MWPKWPCWCTGWDICTLEAQYPSELDIHSTRVRIKQSTVRNEMLLVGIINLCFCTLSISGLLTSPPLPHPHRNPSFFTLRIWDSVLWVCTYSLEVCAYPILFAYPVSTSEASLVFNSAFRICSFSFALETQSTSLRFPHYLLMLLQLLPMNGYLHGRFSLDHVQ